jgi:PhoH-like ATPase
MPESSLPPANVKNYLLDTNVLIHDASSMFAFEDNHVYVLVSVLKELDNLKSKPGETGANARRAARNLDALREKGLLCKGVELDNGGRLFVIPHMKDGLDLDLSEVDNQLLTTALKLKEATGMKSVVVTKDVNLRVRADGVGILAEDFKNDQLDGIDYNGYSDLIVPCCSIDALYADGRLDMPAEASALPLNHYLRLVCDADPKKTGLARVADGNLEAVEANHSVLGIKGKNLPQCFALHALMDERIRVVTLRGKAGTGKTLLAIAVGLFRVLGEDGPYRKLTITRPTIPVGNDLGFLPGDMDEKMLPWMRPIQDAFDTIRESDSRSGKSHIPANFVDRDIVEVAPLAYVRGRSIAGSFMIIDEVQNITPHEVKTLITRSGLNTKIVLTGDVDQIDNPYLDARSNGLSHLISKFRGQDLYAHIELVRGERSRVAELAATIL